MSRIEHRSRFRVRLFTAAAATVATALLATNALAQRVAQSAALQPPFTQPRFVPPTASSLSSSSTTSTAPRLVTTEQQQQLYINTGWGKGVGIEPFAGRLQFDREMRQADQNVAGARAGVYLGASMRARAYWWQGEDTTTNATSKLQSYGGELEIGIQDLWFVHPFIVLGGGRFDYQDDYRSLDSLPREDQNVWIAGGGLKIRPLEWLEVNAAYRDNLLRPPRVRDRWLNNHLWSVGISFRYGGTPSQTQTTMYGPAGAAAAGAQGTTTAAAAVASGKVATIPVPINGGEIKVVYSGDTLRLQDSAGVARAMATGVLTIEAVRDLVSSELAYLNALYPVPFGTQRTALTPEQADTLTRRLGLRTNGVYDYLVRGQAEAIRAAMKSELTAKGVDEASQAKILTRLDAALAERIALNDAQSVQIMIRNDSAYARRVREEAAADQRTVTAGIGGFSEFYLDSHLSFRSPWLKELTLGPQVALGFFGGGVSALVAGNATYLFEVEGKTRPYGGLGLGLLVRGDEIDGKTGTSFVINPTFGVEFANSSARMFGEHARGYFVELQGVDLFKNTRLIGGVTWKF